MNSRASLAPWRLSLSATLFLAILVALVATLPGCGGCKKEDPIAKKKREAEEREKEKERKRKLKAEEPKPNFEMSIQVLPNYEIVERDIEKEREKEEEQDQENDQEQQSAFTYVKPGHWGQAINKIKANNFDFPGRLRTSAIDARRLPLEVERTNYRLVSFRSAVLPKGQAKQIDTLFFLPRRESTFQGAYNLNSELLSARGGGTQHASFRLSNSLDEHQYFIVVLAANNSSYVYMNNLRSVVVTDSTIADFGGLRFYRVILPKIDRSVPLPGNLQTWTMIAYLVWDDIDPALLTPEQRTATIDWLHWGGQIIVSGPNSLDKLRGSFLAPYLPAQGGAVRKLTQGDVDELSRHWSLPSKKKGEIREIQILPDKPMVGVELKMHEEGQFVPHTGELVAERRVGGGRIVVTAFPLTDLRIRYWKNFDGFFNGVLLRRPARQFDQSMDLATLEMKWAGQTLSPFVRDPRLSTTMRIFTRDIGYLAGQAMPAAAEAPPPRQIEQQQYYGPGFPQPAQEPAAQYTSLEHPDVDDGRFSGYQAQPSSGVGGWNDFSGAADAARDSLDESAKIEIPQAGFVLQVLAVYLLVLVPLNWLVFWLMGRVEWSWAAAPVIAIVGAVCVIRLAQLNIGFVRSRTEIAVLEVQRDYPRAHLTRYTTLYTSLSTAYQVSFEDPSAVSLPFVVDEKFVRQPNEWPQVAEFHRDKGTLLSGIQVNSNSTEKVHSEQMLDLKGPISLVSDGVGGQRLKNSSNLTLRDVGIIRRAEGTEFPRFDVAYVSEMRPQTMVSLSFARYVPPAEDEAKRNWAAYRTPWVQQWDKSLVMSAKPTAGEEDDGTVRLHRLVDLTVKRLRMNPGDVRLVAWSNDELPGMQVWPRPAQTTTQTLVLAHLHRGPLSEPQRDVNVSDDFKVPDPLDETEPAPGDSNTIDATQTSFQSKVQSPKSKAGS